MKSEKYLGLSLDPVHIGAGGYRLGRVDNTIVRDPATDIPKIPGTSLAGVIREYSTISVQKNNKGRRESAEKEIEKYFGNQEKQGSLRFYDGEIILFPVSSEQGTVWISTKELVSFWLHDNNDKNEELIKEIPTELNEKVFPLKGIVVDKINLGWFLQEIIPNSKKNNENFKLSVRLEDKIKRIAVVSDQVFSQLINDSLEVRTSVKIDYQTGAAEAGKLFTYEAIPRGTVFGFEMVFDERRQENTYNFKPMLEAAFDYLKLLGIGGMGTRGFGRVTFFAPNNDVKGEKTNG